MSIHTSDFHEFPDFDNLIANLGQIRPKIDSNFEKVLNTATPTNDDARLSAFSHLAQLIDSTILAMTFMNKNLLPLDNSWWQEIYKTPFEPFNDYHKSLSINSFNNSFIKFGFLQTLLGILDNHFRIFLREIDSAVCNGATAEFLSIYEALKKRIGLYNANDDSLVNLLRMTRNTIHNNGVYFHKSNTNEQTVYKGKTYDFNIGKPVDFVSWEWLIEMLEDVRILLEKTVFNPQIINITTEIADPFSKNRTIVSR